MVLPRLLTNTARLNFVRICTGRRHAARRGRSRDRQDYARAVVRVKTRVVIHRREVGWHRPRVGGQNADMLLDVREDSYLSACDLLYRDHQAIALTVRRLVADPSGAGGMAGNDAGGLDWAAAYDGSVSAALRGGAD